MSGRGVRYSTADGVASVVFDRPEAYNAMTMAMYDQLAEACAAIAADSNVRVATFRGTGQAFVAGTDINEFMAFDCADDGIAYERRIDEVINGIESLPVPTIAVIEGAAMGGGLLIAAACDLRIATPAGSFGVPIARTVGNCLSLANTARIVAVLGPARAKRLLLLADSLSAEEALSCGFVVEVVQPEGIEEALNAMCRQLVSHAPITMRVAKESIRRLSGALPEGDDLIRIVYASSDFKTGVRAFLTKQRPQWTGR
jgi:enoyl-CoA hydratase/carnithine racemase